VGILVMHGERIVRAWQGELVEGSKVIVLWALSQNLPTTGVSFRYSVQAGLLFIHFFEKSAPFGYLLTS
jgi:hypothetical protein